MIGTCQLQWCADVGPLVFVNENIDDGSWRVGICQQCAGALGIKDGGDLPAFEIVESRLFAAGRIPMKRTEAK